jgi:hypothetical protein
MKKLIDVTLPVTGSITIPISAETDTEAIELALARANLECIQDYDGNGAIMNICIDGNYITLVNVDDENGPEYREVQIGE